MSCNYLNIGQLVPKNSLNPKAANVSSVLYGRTAYDQEMLKKFLNLNGSYNNIEGYEPKPYPASIGVLDTDTGFERTVYDNNQIKKFGCSK